jgi:hypothetical protein
MLDLATDDTSFGSLPTNDTLKDIGSQWHLENSRSQRDSSPDLKVKITNYRKVRKYLQAKISFDNHLSSPENSEIGKSK